MTRRNFGTFFNIIYLTMIGNLEGMNVVDNTKGLRGGKQHIRNRRLFNFAAGEVELAGWERGHLHECAVCQTMGSLLVTSINRFPDLKFKQAGR